MRNLPSKKLLYRLNKEQIKYIPTAKKLLIESQLNSAIKKKILLSTCSFVKNEITKNSDSDYPNYWYRDTNGYMYASHETYCLSIVYSNYMDGQYDQISRYLLFGIHDYYEYCPYYDFVGISYNQYIRNCIIHEPINYIYKNIVSYSRCKNIKRCSKCHIIKYFNDSSGKLDYHKCNADAKLKVILKIKDTSNSKIVTLKRFITCYKCFYEMNTFALNNIRINIIYSYEQQYKKIFSYEQQFKPLNDNSEFNKHIFTFSIYPSMINLILNNKFQTLNLSTINSLSNIIIGYLD